MNHYFDTRCELAKFVAGPEAVMMGFVLSVIPIQDAHLTGKPSSPSALRHIFDPQIVAAHVAAVSQIF